LCLVQSRDLQALLELKPTKVQLSNLTMAEIFNLNERTAPSGSQFVRGLAYWLAIGDHLFFIKTHSMTSEYIRAYLDWLVKISTSTIDQSVPFRFQAEFDPSQVAGDIGDIRNLKVSGKASPQFVVATPRDEPDKPRVKMTSRTVGEKFLQFEQAIPMIRALFGQARANSLIDCLGKDEYLAVNAEVKVQGKRTEASRVKLREIASELADLTDAKVQIDGKDGKVSDGDAILRTRMPFELPSEGSTLLEFDNVADQLQEVYARFVKDGKIGA